ncbi:DUF4180 domain-containing protein [Shinella kummerowiae]|uniref:DUF4180 domain-containing protein n=1 Tax=Shinella kummerowiae TaxID=417745 RepID=A0A6N8S3R9_9HYPH|nr:DUF4180 domain-containing protein [Shinella kummerowiae]MXN43735.1 DUF4180 domain-containing protein [Shinella kummerowiae]
MDWIDMGGTKVLLLPVKGPQITTEADGNDVIGEAFSVEAELIAIPVERLGSSFLRLETRLAGTIFQKFVNYHLRCAIIGDIAPLLEGSKALRDFVRETNKGRSIWFVDDLDGLRAKLAREKA